MDDNTSVAGGLGKKMKRKIRGKRNNRGMEEPIRDKNRKIMKRCRTRTNHHNSYHNREEKERCWSELPNEILDMIVKRIYFIDLINLRATCKSWRYSFNGFQPRKEIPWRMVFDDLPSANSSCKLINPTNKKTYIVNDTKIKEKKLYDMEVLDSKCGWVLMSSQSFHTSGTFFLLYTPFLTENNIIELPVLNSRFHVATFSSAPSLGTTQDDCVFFAIGNCSYGNDVLISTCRRGDHTWRTQHFECYFPLTGHEVVPGRVMHSDLPSSESSSGVRSVVYSQGVFYCPSSAASLGCFNVDRQEWVVLEPENKSIVMFCVHNATSYIIQLMKSDDDGGFILVVYWDYGIKWCVPPIVVIKLDHSKMVWEGLACLGDRAIFIASKGTCFVMEFPEYKGRALLCSTKRVAHFRLLLTLDYIGGRSYPCTKFYGSHTGQKQIWIEPFV